MSGTMTVKEARDLTGGLSAPSKMPGHAFSIPASACVTGSKLRQVEGSRCHQCYAFRGNYVFDNVQRSLQRRLESLRHPRWVEAMVVLIKDAAKEHKGCGSRCDGHGCRFFRWHDSGDLQGAWHLERIVEVCRQTPKVKHWLPTGEHRMLLMWADNGYPFPTNLSVRVSATMVNGKPPELLAVALGLRVSTVHKGVEARVAYERSGAFICPAHDQDNKCQDCRACWDRRVKHVSYRKH